MTTQIEKKTICPYWIIKFDFLINMCGHCKLSKTKLDKSFLKAEIWAVDLFTIEKHFGQEKNIFRNHFYLLNEKIIWIISKKYFFHMVIIKLGWYLMLYNMWQRVAIMKLNELQTLSGHILNIWIIQTTRDTSTQSKPWIEE
jgi:hypothetical protein